MKKDKMTFYLARNIIIVSLIAIIAMTTSIMQYYHCDLSQGLQRIFIYNMMTLLYLLLLCSLNYCIFEFSKIIIDHYEHMTSIITALVLIIIAFIIKILPIHSLFQYNFFYLILLIALRIIKQLYKKRSLM